MAFGMLLHPKKLLSLYSKFMIFFENQFVDSRFLILIYREALHGNHKSPSEAAEELCNLALRLGTSDNVTVVITQFLFT